ncbi:hypothetical protein Hamer_G009421 [Homarus americanus]|uniref:Uncharacterized protein n=1 Tax=Homarus americanus TaxID=6706 RepID=A0A8J5J4F7_HOMAM|nr:hypothetical protein Hamer_G009421 [Homarus americanus]
MKTSIDMTNSVYLSKYSPRGDLPRVAISVWSSRRSDALLYASQTRRYWLSQVLQRALQKVGSHLDGYPSVVKTTIKILVGSSVNHLRLSGASFKNPQVSRTTSHKRCLEEDLSSQWSRHDRYSEGTPQEVQKGTI